MQTFLAMYTVGKKGSVLIKIESVVPSQRDLHTITSLQIIDFVRALNLKSRSRLNTNQVIIYVQYTVRTSQHTSWHVPCTA